MPGSNGIAECLIGGWSSNGVLTWDTGQPQTIGCSRSTGAGNGCFALYTGTNPYAGQSVDHWYNYSAFQDPGLVTSVGQSNYSPLGGGNTQVSGPPIHRMDFSLFKSFPITERTRIEVRAESFNLTNTPSFALPGSTYFPDHLNFGKIYSTRDSPNDPRELQFALKLYW